MHVFKVKRLSRNATIKIALHEHTTVSLGSCGAIGVFQSTCVFVFASFLLTAVVALLDWFVQLENARNRLVVKGPGDRFGEKRSHVKLPDFSGKLPLILYGIRYQQVIQVFHVRDALPCPTQRGRAEDPVRRPGVDRTRSQVGEFLDVALERRSGVHEIVDDDALAPLHVPDHLRGVFRFAPSLPVLCDEGELDVLAAQPLKDVPEYGGPGDLPLVRGNHSYFFVAGSEFLVEIRRGDGDRHQVLYRDFGAEESSERVVVEIQAHHVVDSHLLIHDCDIGGGHRLSAELLVLAGIAKVWNDRRDGLDARPAQGRNHQGQLHDRVVARGRTNQVDVLTANGFPDLHPGLSVGKLSHAHAVEVPPEEVGNVAAQVLRAGTGQQNKLALFLRFDLGRLVKVHLFSGNEISGCRRRR
mmetsp:Transcript_91991/g.187257  ORF Transcript_91991/g.187257 Transcript_91991/m.187257 type:complete len:413 (+) Transcript_91991:857-2095(+)